MECAFDNWFSTVAKNVDDMPDFHADEWSKMLGASTFDTQPDDEIKEPAQKLMQLVGWDMDNATDKEEALQQQMLKPNPLTEPNCSVTKPNKT